MANYRISEDAKADLRRIYRRGVREYGEAQADQYYDAFFDRFEQLALRPFIDHPRMDDQPADLLDPNSARTRFDGEKISATANFAPHVPLGNLALNGEWVINRYSTRARMCVEFECGVLR